ncbi:hypothetical protein niasHS_010783 [Heterodera schachtii]|uniref:DNA polymerase epsilon subunit 3 n=1 Tax=Heterodera schachtii TaxID=97005 RepID=A0ABD2IUS1_HETSC
MEVNPADLNFPKAVIARIIKEALPDGVTVSKEAKNAIARSAAIFILHATSLANDNAQSKKRKNLIADDVLYAINQLECDELENPVKEALTLYTQKKNQRQQHRRERRAKQREEKRFETKGKGETEEKGQQEDEQSDCEQGMENGDEDGEEEEEEEMEDEVGQ